MKKILSVALVLVLAVGVLGISASAYADDAQWHAVSAGLNHTLALDSHGNVWAWGSNAHGQLGVASDLAIITSPLLVAGPDSARSEYGLTYEFVQVSAGENHSLALTAAGLAFSWGANESGQLGRPNCPCHAEAQQPPAIVDRRVYAQIEAGGNRSFAICADGLAWGWGCNRNGWLGVGSTSAAITAPAAILAGSSSHGQSSGSQLSDVMAISASANHVLATVTSRRVLWTWGSNRDGQQGRSFFFWARRSTSRAQPSGQRTLWNNVRYIDNVIQIAAGDRFSLIVRAEDASATSGQLMVAGNNQYGQLAIDTGRRSQQNTFINGASTIIGREVGLDNTTHVAVGSRHAVAILSNGDVFTWGGGTWYGERGYQRLNVNKTHHQRLNVFGGPRFPMSLGGAEAGVQISAVGYRTFVIAVDSSGNSLLLASGNNTHGELGNGTNNTSVLRDINGEASVQVYHAFVQNIVHPGN